MFKKFREKHGIRMVKNGYLDIFPMALMGIGVKMNGIAVGEKVYGIVEMVAPKQPEPTDEIELDYPEDAGITVEDCDNCEYRNDCPDRVFSQ